MFKFKSVHLECVIITNLLYLFSFSIASLWQVTPAFRLLWLAEPAATLPIVTPAPTLPPQLLDLGQRVTRILSQIVLWEILQPARWDEAPWCIHTSSQLCQQTYQHFFLTDDQPLSIPELLLSFVYMQITNLATPTKPNKTFRSNPLCFACALCLKWRSCSRSVNRSSHLTGLRDGLNVSGYVFKPRSQTHFALVFFFSVRLVASAQTVISLPAQCQRLCWTAIWCHTQVLSRLIMKRGQKL